MKPLGIARLSAITICLVLFSAACGSISNNQPATELDSGATDNTSSTAAPFAAQPIDWKACKADAAGTPAAAGVTCGYLEVPFDYDNPDLGSFVLFLKKRAADPALRIGSMLVNPGGPGFGGSSLASDAAYYFSSTLVKYFDIIGWDPRGTGESTPAVDCVDSYDKYFGLDSPPETPEENQALIDAGAAFSKMCDENSGSILPYISTRSSATDMNSIREALGEDKITYFGFSYGSELGAT